MGRRIILSLIIIGLGLSLLACTTNRYPQRYPDPRYPNYPQYPGGPGYPGYPGSGYGPQQIENLAEDLSKATGEVIAEARKKEQEGSSFQEHAIERLEELHKEAKAFLEDLNDRDTRDDHDEYGYDPRYGDPRYGDPRYGDPRFGSYPGYGMQPNRKQFSVVLQKYYSARNTLRGLHWQDDVQQDFDRVTRIMRNLASIYQYRFDPDYEYLENMGR